MEENKGEESSCHFVKFQPRKKEYIWFILGASQYAFQAVIGGTNLLIDIGNSYKCMTGKDNIPWQEMIHTKSLSS